MTKILMYIVLIFTSLTLFGRSDFVNLTIAVTIWLIFIREKRYDITEYLDNFFKALGVVSIYDFFWLVFHTNGFWNEEYFAGIRRISLIFSYLNFFAKILLAASIIVQKAKLKEDAKKAALSNSLHKNISGSSDRK